VNAVVDTARDFEAELRRNEPMSKHTSWRVGGPADIFFKPSSFDQLQRFLRSLPSDTAITWVGLGSNLLVRDRGIRGVVIATAGLERSIERIGEGRVRAGAGVTCARLARQCAQWGLGPASFFAGIPGTVGGALAMNAGAFGGETWERVETVETVDRHGDRHVRRRGEYAIGYRTVSGPAAEWFIAAVFHFDTGAPATRESIRQLLAKRAASQPLGYASCGSVFRNPQGDAAGRLIESAGLKGSRIGDAAVSDKHANFIVNIGNATAVDIERLINHIRAEVERVHGLRLELEVRIVGEPEGASI
jgi:UDP-N-acetylmuramate dehydrogenase